MSSSKSELGIPKVTEGSSVTEMISLLRCSFQQQEYDKVERLLICREKKLRMELNNLREDFDLMKKDHDSLEKAHAVAELNRLTMEQDFERCKHDCEESREQFNGLRAEYEASIDRERRVERRYDIVVEDLRKVENENKTQKDKMIEELAKKNEELDAVRSERNKMVKLICEKRNAEETVSLLKSHLQKFGGRVSVLDENVAKLLAVDVLQVRRGIYVPEVDVEVEGSFPLSSAVMESSVNGGLSDGMDVSAFEGVQEEVHESENSTEEAASRIPVAKGPLSPIIVEISDSENESLAVGSSDASVLCATEVNPIGKKMPLQEDDVGNFKVTRRKTTDSAFLCDDTDDLSGSEDFESYMENKVAKFKRYNESTWKFADDMLSAFEKDYELCMNAVCGLYREKIYAEKSKINSLIPGDLVFFHFDAMSGKALAEYLIDGDPQNKLKKTVLEVWQEDPRVLFQCKDLAIHYSEKIFDIYTKGRDRFFRTD